MTYEADRLQHCLVQLELPDLWCGCASAGKPGEPLISTFLTCLLTPGCSRSSFVEDEAYHVLLTASTLLSQLNRSSTCYHQSSIPSYTVYTAPALQHGVLNPPLLPLLALRRPHHPLPRGSLTPNIHLRPLLRRHLPRRPEWPDRQHRISRHVSLLRLRELQHHRPTKLVSSFPSTQPPFTRQPTHSPTTGAVQTATPAPPSPPPPA